MSSLGRLLSVNIPEIDEISAGTSSLKDYASLQEYSVKKREEFWSLLAKRRIEWFKDFDKVTEGDFNDPDFNLKWFINGKLNVSGMILNFQFSNYILYADALSQL